MDRLTLIADLTCAASGSYTENYLRSLCERAATALQSLSQEAVRDEALEEAAKVCEQESTGEGITGTYQASWGRYLADSIRALKREPNAAASALLGQGWVPVKNRSANYPAAKHLGKWDIIERERADGKLFSFTLPPLPGASDD